MRRTPVHRAYDDICIKILEEKNSCDAADDCATSPICDQSNQGSIEQTENITVQADSVVSLSSQDNSQDCSLTPHKSKLVRDLACIVEKLAKKSKINSKFSAMKSKIQS